MKFHELHGVNATIDETRKVARRISSFCDAFVFSEVPLRLNSYTAIRLSSQDAEWQGYCFFGVTSRNPISFIETAVSKHILSLLNTEDVWIKSVPEGWSSASLVIHLTFDGQLEITCEHEPNMRYIFFENLPINFPLWLVIELYGSSNSVQFPVFPSPNSREIVSLGSDSLSTFNCGEEGIVPYNFARTVLIGPKLSGKSLLKSILCNNMSSEQKDIDMAETSNHYLSADNGEWFLLSNLSANCAEIGDRTKSDLYHELAQNLVHEIVITSKEPLDGSSSTFSSKDLIRNVLKLPLKMRKTFTKEVKQLSENVSEIPEELMLIIEDLLKNVVNGESVTKPISSRKVTQKHIINLCDFSGNLLYLIINQFFFTSCAIYLFVFNLSDDLESRMGDNQCFTYISELHNQSSSLLTLIHLWISLIHTTIATFPIPNEDNEKAESPSSSSNSAYEVQPQVLLVGTHRNSIHAEPITRNQIVKEIFEKIFASFADKAYANHLYKNYIALDCKEMSFDEPSLIQSLKKLVEKMVVEEKTTGFNIPLPWMQLGQILEKLKQRAIYFVDINQLHEVVSSQVDAFQSYENLNAALHFYHNQAKIFYLDCVGQQPLMGNERQGSYELGIIILDPNWFVNCVYLLCSYLCNVKADDDNLQFGVISENIINNAWCECIDQKFVLLGCLENLDIICELCPYIQLEDAPDVAATTVLPKLYFFPWITKPIAENEGTQLPSENFGDTTFQFVIAFHLLPLSLFTRLLIRLSKWSWNQGWGRKPEMYHSRARLAVDFDHDAILKVNLMQGRIYVAISKIFEELQNDQIENLFIGPAANVCVKVHHLIESELESLRNVYYRRLNYKLVIPCPCDASCSRHKIEGCIDEKCLHFLLLQDCLKKKVVECKFHRQVRTTFIQRYLPYAPTVNNNNGCDTVTRGDRLALDELMYDAVYAQNPNDVWDNIFQVEPLWMREAAKLLNANQLSNDWIALAKRLSYTERDISKFSEEISPSLSLLKDWYESNGRTRYCIDVLVSCLRMLSRDDIASLIEYELEPESSSPPVFLSYQRDSQKQVFEIRRKLELSGFPCWMDTSSLGGGDSLYGKIYEGISRAKVFICCLTPRYLASPICNREVTLADVLHKSILPLMIEFTSWPPPGGMALILSSLVYVDLCGIGSHSGIGKLQDMESRFRDILDRVSRYISGYSDMPVVSSRYLQLPDLFNGRRNEPGPSSTMRNVLNRQVSEARSLSPPSDSHRQQHHHEQERDGDHGERTEETAQEAELPFADDLISGDNISVITRARIANRITNCSVCSLM